MPIERVETLIIGGGQAGLTMSHRLKQRGLEHLVLERQRIAERWRSERWDGLRFQFPNWSVRLPDFPYPHSDPDGFATGREISVFNVHLGIGEAVLIPALASGSHTRASAPGRISKENSELGGRFYGKLGNLRSCCWKLMPGSLLTTDERGVAKRTTMKH